MIQLHPYGIAFESFESAALYFYNHSPSPLLSYMGHVGSHCSAYNIHLGTLIPVVIG